MMAVRTPRWSLTRKIVLGTALALGCCAVAAAMIVRDLRNIDFGDVVVYKEGVGPSYEETLAGGTD